MESRTVKKELGPCKAAKGKGFTQIWNSFIRDRGISGKAKLLAIIYASYSNENADAWPGSKTLSGLTGWKKYSLQKARSELREKGLLARIPVQSKRGQFQGVKFRVSEKILARRKPENPSDGPSGERASGPTGP
jgi:hypothetical protein